MPRRHRFGRHRRERAELLLALLSRLSRPFRDPDDRLPASAVAFAGLFLFFAVLLMGASR